MGNGKMRKQCDIILAFYRKFLKVLFLLILFCFFTAVPSAQAGNGLRQIPLRWCAVQGSPAVTNPGGVGEPDTDNVLWRRHERASDNIWIPGANITFRSGLTATILNQANFPVINDPTPPASGGPGQLGDILDPQINPQELNNAIATCQTEWDNLARQFNTPLLGPIALNLRQFVDNMGNPINLIGWGGFTAINGGANTCANPPTGLTSAINGYASVVDNSFRLGGDPIDALLAHELGHVLRLGHGNGLDDDNDGVYDDNVFGCDPDENMNAPPANMMNPTVGSGVITALQAGTSQAVAQVYSGVQIDPPGTLVNGDTVSDQRVDPIQDVADSSVDITWVAITENTPTQTTIFTHGLLGTIPFEANHQYLVFADLDGNPATGGTPSDLGFSTNFQGAELVTRVRVELINEFVQAIPTVWKFQGGTFVEVNDPNIRADLVAAVGGENGQASYDAVSIQMPNAVRGIAATQIRIQAIAQRLDPEGQLDRLPEPRDGGDNIVLVPPKFPVCSVTPTTIPAGGIATVEANSLIPNRTAKVFLGDQMVATPPIDNQGNVSTNFIVPSDSREGSRLVTVGVMGTALTADCSVNVTPPKLSRYEYTPKLVCGIQKDPRNMGLAKGFYGTTINIHNPGLSKVGFAKKLALTFPPGNQNSGQVLPIAADELESNHALAVDCNDLRTRLFNGTFPEPYIEGFVVIQSPQSLDVTAVYTNADLNWKGQAKEASSIDVEQINERINLEQN
jgi:hypothetical protein